MKKQKIDKYRLISPVITAFMFLVFMRNTVSGKSVTEVVIPLLLMLMGFVLFFAGPKIEKKEQKKKREESLKKEFPEFALKVSMLIRAGFSPKASLERMANGYPGRKKKSVLMEEVITTLREMESGVPEIQAYENFAARCGLLEVIRFSGLLIRDIKRGSSCLSEELKEESRKAMEAQKEIIKKRGETAGTKLLFPIMLFLLIVMVIILYPAFTTIAII